MSAKVIKIELPIVTVSEANRGSEHWRIKAKRHKLQKAAVYKLMRAQLLSVCLPCRIKMTRIAPRFLDKHDNLPMSQKYLVDAICEILIPGKAVGRADDSDQLTICYDQEKRGVKEYGVVVEIEWQDVA